MEKCSAGVSLVCGVFCKKVTFFFFLFPRAERVKGEGVWRVIVDVVRHNCVEAA